MVDMMTIKTMPALEQDDADLVAESLDGSRDAFRRIVERYQTLICSLAYSATGNVSRSEDMAQETFIAAWKQLGALREPAKLRAWLCGIARHRTQKCLLRDGREPALNAAPLEALTIRPPSKPYRPSKPSAARRRRFCGGRWKKSRSCIANAHPVLPRTSIHQTRGGGIGLTEDAVKQRLVRGRKILQDEVQTFVEGALRRTAPSQAFSGAVRWRCCRWQRQVRQRQSVWAREPKARRRPNRVFSLLCCCR